MEDANLKQICEDFNQFLKEKGKTTFTYKEFSDFMHDWLLIDENQDLFTFEGEG
jgi:hypothetical protein